MKASEIKVGGYYIALVNGKLTTVRVENVKETLHGTYYQVTNLASERKTMFRNTKKFVREATNPLNKHLPKAEQVDMEKILPRPASLEYRKSGEGRDPHD